MNQQSALEHAKAMMEQGKTAAEANVELVRMEGVRLVTGRIDRDTRNPLLAAVARGQLGHLPKKGLKPAAFFHPNSLAKAKSLRNQAAHSSVEAIKKVCK